MNKRSNSREQRVRRVALRSLQRRLSVNDRWLLSFGDMLTLVLCFFICLLVSVDGANQRSRIRTIQDMPDKSRAGALHSTKIENWSGTQLAKSSLEESKMLFLFGKTSFDQDGEKLLEETSEELTTALISIDCEECDIQIGACAQTELDGADSKLMTDVSRLLSIRSQLIDTSFKTDGLKLDFREMNCDGLAAMGHRIGKGSLLSYLRLTSQQIEKQQGDRE